jgi:hypothetical protein
MIYAGSVNAARELEWFSASFSRGLSDLSLAGDDAHKIHSLAPGVATRSGTRAGSRSKRAGDGCVKTEAHGSERN